MAKLKLKMITLILILQFLMVPVAADLPTITYTSYNGSFSFKYSSSWEVFEDDSLVKLKNSKLNQELWLMFVPYNPSRTPKEHAKSIVSAFTIINPTFTLDSWISDLGEDGVLFELDYREGDTKYKGIGLVLFEKKQTKALWLHFLAPIETYQLEEAIILAQSLIDSFTLKATPQEPIVKTSIMDKIDYKTAYLNRNARALVDILEFALDESLTKQQKDTLTKDLVEFWGRPSDAELALYNQYPKYLDAIKSISDLEKLELLRITLRHSFETRLSKFVAVIKKESS